VLFRSVNPSGWISQGDTSIPQASLVKSRSNGSKSSIRGQKPNSSFFQNSGSTHSQPSGQRPNDSEVESESEPEDLNEIHRRGRFTDLGNSKLVLDHFASLLTSPTAVPPQPRGPSVTRAQTIEFAPTPQLRSRHQPKLSKVHSHTQPDARGGGSQVEVASKSPRTGALRA